MRWADLMPMLIAPALLSIAVAIAFRNWRRRIGRIQLWQACAMAGILAGMVLQATLTVARRAWACDLPGHAFVWITMALFVGPVVSGIVIGNAVEKRITGTRSSQSERDFADPET